MSTKQKLMDYLVVLGGNASAAFFLLLPSSLLPAFILPLPPCYRPSSCCHRIALATVPLPPPHLFTVTTSHRLYPLSRWLPPAPIRHSQRSITRILHLHLALLLIYGPNGRSLDVYNDSHTRITVLAISLAFLNQCKTSTSRIPSPAAEAHGKYLHRLHNQLANLRLLHRT